MKYAISFAMLAFALGVFLGLSVAGYKGSNAATDGAAATLLERCVALAQKQDSLLPKPAP